VKRKNLGNGGSAFLCCLALSAVASAQAPVDPSAPLPPGHPAVGTPPAAAAEPAPVDPSAPLPPGHPAVGTAPAADEDTDDDAPAEAMPPGHPGAPAGEPPQDRTSPAPDLRAGSIEVHLHDEKDRPITGMAMRLAVMKQDVAEGDSRSERPGTTDGRGVALFEGLPTGSAYSFRVTAAKDAGTFASEPLRLGETGGQRVLLHVYPVTRDVRRALIGMRGVVFIQPREDVFHIESSFQVINIGMQAWVPDGTKITLPTDAKAFRTSDSMSDTRVERGASGDAELLGTYGPGQRDIGYQFQLDNLHVPRRTIRIGLPPHVAELRIVAEGARGMVLSAEGFPEPEPMQGQDGSRLLVTGRRLERGDQALASIEITLDNLPVPSAGRWYAVVIACLLGALGLGTALRDNPQKKAVRSVDPADVKQAEELVLDELVALEKLRREERVGPRTYEETRVELLDALTRLELHRTSA
jgi:hypothetical protein